jgi:aspartyl-tRNA(Asn)/glutamyl-tRNA(Gln) amidotransferase subunit C
VGISREEVQRLAALARLQFTPAEERELIDHLHKLLVAIQKLNEVNTEGVGPMVQVVEMPSPMRADRVTNQPDTEALLRNAPAREGDFFKVPRIIE